MIREILKLGDVRLLRIARPVENINDPALENIIADLRDTLTAANSFGLAAPQIGVDLRIMIFGMKENPHHPNEKAISLTTLINPWIEMLTRETAQAPESCLSVPGMRGLVPRVTHIRYGGTLQDGTQLEREATSFHARLFQHEYDHLDGVLYPHRITDMTKFGFVEALFPGNEWAVYR